MWLSKVKRKKGLTQFLGEENNQKYALIWPLRDPI